MPASRRALRVLFLASLSAAAIGFALSVLVVIDARRGLAYGWRLHNDTAAAAVAQAVDLHDGRARPALRVPAGQTVSLPRPATDLGDAYRVSDAAGQPLGCFTADRVTARGGTPLRVTVELSQVRACPTRA